jgi:hypothetical protein
MSTLRPVMRSEDEVKVQPESGQSSRVPGGLSAVGDSISSSSSEESISSSGSKKRSSSAAAAAEVKSAKIDPLAVEEHHKAAFLEIYRTIATDPLYVIATPRLSTLGSQVETVYALSFVSFVIDNAELKGHLKIVRDSWTTMPAWKRTKDDFATNMTNHKEKNQEHFQSALEAFLAKLDQGHHGKLRAHVQEHNFHGFLEYIINI